MFDSGSTTSLLPGGIARKIQNCDRKAVSHSLVTASGNVMDILAEVELEICIKNVQVLHTFIIVSSLIVDSILGVDFLSLHKMKLDFINRTVYGPGMSQSSNSEKPNNLLNTICACHK